MIPHGSDHRHSISATNNTSGQLAAIIKGQCLDSRYSDHTNQLTIRNFITSSVVLLIMT